MLFALFRFGKGKRRSKIGKLIDDYGYTQEELVQSAKVSRNTISKVCNDPDYIPSPTVMKKILNAIRSIDPGAKADKYFDL